MECIECGKHPMKFVYCWDDPSIGYAYNLYACDGCGKITKKNVWNDKGTDTIKVNGEVIHERT